MDSLTTYLIANANVDSTITSGLDWTSTPGDTADPDWDLYYGTGGTGNKEVGFGSHGVTAGQGFSFTVYQWVLDGLGLDDEPGTYTGTVTFTITEN
jgi:hypothetical protein